MNSETLTSMLLPSLSVAFIATLLAAIGFWRKAVHLERNLRQAITKEQERGREALGLAEKRHAQIQNLRQAITEEQERGREALRLAEKRHEQIQKEEKTNALSVVVHPFVNTEAKKGVFSREIHAQIGYKYQLFIQGLPCFEPHTMVLESSVHKEVDKRTLEILTKKALQAAEAAIHIKSGGAAKVAITIAKALIKSSDGVHT